METSPTLAQNSVDYEANQQSCNSDLLNESEGEDDHDDGNLLEEGFVNMHIQLVEIENKKEDEEANAYVNKFIDTDLDPNTPGDEGDSMMTLHNETKIT